MIHGLHVLFREKRVFCHFHSLPHVLYQMNEKYMLTWVDGCIYVHVRGIWLSASIEIMHLMWFWFEFLLQLFPYSTCNMGLMKKPCFSQSIFIIMLYFTICSVFVRHIAIISLLNQQQTECVKRNLIKLKQNRLKICS